MTTDEIISRCYEHGQPDYILAGDSLKKLQAECAGLREANNTWVALHGPTPVPTPVQRAYALLWRDMGPPSDYAKEARKILRELLSYEQTRAAIYWVKQVHSIDSAESEIALQVTDWIMNPDSRPIP